MTILGISPDTSKAQAKFRDKNDLNFTLLADDVERLHRGQMPQNPRAAHWLGWRHF